MNRYQRPRYEMFNSVLAFVDGRKEIFVPGTFICDAADRLDRLVEDIRNHSATQERYTEHSDIDTDKRVKVREDLRKAIRMMVTIARLIEPTHPGTRERFKPYRGQSDATLLLTARTFAEQAAPLAAQFNRYMLSEDWIADLNEKIRQVEQQLSGRASDRRTLIGATASLRAALKEGMRIVDEMDVLLANILKGELEEHTIQWEIVKQVRKVRRRKRGTQEDPETGKATAASGGTP